MSHFKKEWFAAAKDGDPLLDEILNDFSKTIEDKIVSKLVLPKEAKVICGPLSTSHAGLRKSVLFQITIADTISISVENNKDVIDPNNRSKLKLGFQTSKTQLKLFSADGVISYLNEIWIKKQNKKLKNIDKREKATNDIINKIDTMAITKFTLADAPHIFKMRLLSKNYRRSSNLVSNKTICFVFCSKNDLEMLDSASKLLKGMTYAHYSHYSHSREIWNKIDGTKSIIVLIRKHTNKAKIIKCRPQYYRNQETNWFNPDNIIKYLDREISKDTSFAKVLADPDVEIERNSTNKQKKNAELAF